MARIRSIHPGIWTDEGFVTLSAYARLLLIGLWNECDDKGIFEWKPITLKMRLMPADNVDVANLLAEIEAVNAVCQYTVNGKIYGAVRNFRKFQKPKTPNDVHPAPLHIRNYVGLESAVSEVIDHEEDQFPPKGEKLLLMEEGGEEGEEESNFVNRAGEEKYRFAGVVVRLDQKDYTRFRKQFHAITDFDAELTALDGWLGAQSEAKQKNWFGSVASWLNKRHQDNLANSRAGPKPVAVGV
jgi:hypothetical protein